jgi:hypothetical protein
LLIGVLDFGTLLALKFCVEYILWYFMIVVLHVFSII